MAAVAEEERIERVFLHLHKTPAGGLAYKVEVVETGGLAVGLNISHLKGQQVDSHPVEVVFGHLPLLVGLIETAAEHHLAVGAFVVGGHKLAQRGDELEGALAQIALPGELAVVGAFHGGGVVGTPAVGGGVAYQVERGRHGGVGNGGETDGGGLYTVLTAHQGGDAAKSLPEGASSRV